MSCYLQNDYKNYAAFMDSEACWYFRAISAKKLKKNPVKYNSHDLKAIMQK